MNIKHLYYYVMCVSAFKAFNTVMSLTLQNFKEEALAESPRRRDRGAII